MITKPKLDKAIFKRLKQGNWCIKIKNDHELALVLNACSDAGIAWESGFVATAYCPKSLITEICFLSFAYGITFGCNDSEIGENITDLFFSEITQENTHD